MWRRAPVLLLGRDGVVAAEEADGPPDFPVGVPLTLPLRPVGLAGVVLPELSFGFEGVLGVPLGFESCFITIPSTCKDLLIAASC